MATITEDYVSFETAKLLKEKRFDADIDLWYDKDGNIFDCYKYEISRNWRVKAQQEVYFCPTLQMAMKWLRNNHQIFISPNISFLYPIRYYCEIFCYGDNLKTQQDVTTENFESPEQACEAAVKYCLENFDLNNYDNN